MPVAEKEAPLSISQDQLVSLVTSISKIAEYALHGFEAEIGQAHGVGSIGSLDSGA